MSTHQDTMPWHKQWLVWMLIAIPFSAVVMGVILIYLAVTTDDGLVADDYYKKGMTINRMLAKEEHAKQLAISASVEIDASSGFIRLRFDKGELMDYPTQIQAALKHATKEQNDVYVVLQKGMDDQYAGSVSGGVQQGVWYIEINNSIEEDVEQWRLIRRVRLDEVTTVLLQPE